MRVSVVATFGDFWRQTYAAGGGLFTSVLSQRLGAIFAYLGQQLGISPNRITLLGLMISALASMAYALLPADGGALLFTLLMFQVAYGLDCADGQLARATARSSDFGGWLDVVSDLFSMMLLAFCLSYWIVQQGNQLLLIYFFAPMLMVAGRAMTLFTSKFTQRASHPNLKPGENAGILKQLLWLIIDTPTLLLIVCLLRNVPDYLAAYLSVMGLCYLANAAYLALVRLER